MVSPFHLRLSTINDDNTERRHWQQTLLLKNGQKKEPILVIKSHTKSTIEKLTTVGDYVEVVGFCNEWLDNAMVQNQRFDTSSSYVLCWKAFFVSHLMECASARKQSDVVSMRVLRDCKG